MVRLEGIKPQVGRTSSGGKSGDLEQVGRYSWSANSVRSSQPTKWYSPARYISRSWPKSNEAPDGKRPAVDTVPGPIESQLLARCCFKVASGTESRVVLGEDNSAGADLAHPGRGIWQWGEPVVFQGPLLKPEDAEALLARVAAPVIPELGPPDEPDADSGTPAVIPTAIPAEPLGEDDLATPGTRSSRATVQRGGHLGGANVANA